MSLWFNVTWWWHRICSGCLFGHRWVQIPDTYHGGYCLRDGYRECSRCGVFGGYTSDLWEKVA